MEYIEKNLQRFRNTGFTIVEVLIVVTVIVVLVGLSGFAATSYVKTSRDSSRESKATIIANALEKYYDQNGEYPSVALMTNSDTNLVRQKLSITDKDVFKFPLANSSATNSVTNGSASTTQLRYTANTQDQSTPGVATQCQSSAAGYCDFFTLSYVKEVDGQTVTIKSQNSSTVVNVTPNTPSKPTVSASFISNSLIRLSTTSVTCGTSETAEYKIRYNNASASESSMPAWNDLSWSSSTTRDINPGSQVNFYLQSIARCVNEFDVASADSPASDIITFVKPTPPTTPTVTATAIPTSSTSVTLTFSATGPQGYSINYTVSGGGSAASCKTSPCTVTGLSGSTAYTFYVTASNIAGSSPYGAANVTTTAAPSTPAAPGNVRTYVGDATYLTWTWDRPVCNVGSIQYRYRLYYPGYNTFTSQYTTSSESATFDTSSQGYIYRLYVQARCVNGSEGSSFSGESNSPDWVRQIQGASWIFDGWTRVIAFSGSNSLWGQSGVTNNLQSCPATAPSTLRYHVSLNDIDRQSPFSVNAESGVFGYWRTDMDLGDKLEFKWASACYNATTGQISNGGWNRSDIFGNAIIEQNRNLGNGRNGQWSRNCGGEFFDQPDRANACLPPLDPRGPVMQ